MELEEKLKSLAEEKGRGQLYITYRKYFEEDTDNAVEYNWVSEENKENAIKNNTFCELQLFSEYFVGDGLSVLIK